MTVSYEQARADVEGVIGHFPDPTCEHVLMRVDTLRALLSGPPEPSEEEVARAIDPGFRYDDSILNSRPTLEITARVLALFRSRING